MIFRNIAKLVLERRRGVLGSRLRTKLVAMLVFFALAPTTLIFVVSTGFITRSFDQWFSEKVKTTIQQTREAGAMVYKQDQRRLESLARIALHRIVLTPPTEKKPNPKLPIDARRLDGFESEYGLSTVRVFDRDGKLVWSSRRNTGAAAISTASDSFVQSAITRFSSDPGLVSISTVEGEDRQDVVKGVAPLLNSTTQALMGVVLAEERFETRILKSIETILQGFADLRPGAQLIRLTYIILMAVITLLITFAAVWLGFYVARAIVGPIQSLAEATREVALGNYSVSLTAKTDDEAGQLVRSFNQMTKDLRKHKSLADDSRFRLQHINEELEQRRQYMEIVLKNITAGVVAVDTSDVITSVNDAAARILGIKAEVLIGKLVTDGLGPVIYEEFWKPMVSKLSGKSTFSAQIDFELSGQRLNLIADAARIFDEASAYRGTVVVFDDATEQVKAQRIAAWREVARRIAHEIKNPITPIKLSAERILRRFKDQFSGNDREVFESCIETILTQVDSLRDLVNEFSKFSKLPSVQPRPAEINAVIREVVKLFSLSYSEVEIDLQGLQNVPEVSIDPEQMNRVFVNLITNSIGAMDQQSTPPRIQFHTQYVAEANAVRIEVTDNGHGIPDKLKDRVLEPYFSTKDTGTGLGLAIVNQIVSDHGGYLRLSDNKPRGTVVVIELPLGSAPPSRV